MRTTSKYNRYNQCIISVPWKFMHGTHAHPPPVWHGLMVKALACQVEGPGFECHHGKNFGKSVGKKIASHPLLA